MTLTVVTGLVDAVSYLALGHVFVANMTGNVVFLGFAVAGAPGLSALAALAAFLVGAVAGGRIAIRSGEHRGRQLPSAMTVAGASLLLAVLLAVILGQPVSQDARYALIVPLAVAMGSRTRRRAGSRSPTSPPRSSPSRSPGSRPTPGSPADPEATPPVA